MFDLLNRNAAVRMLLLQTSQATVDGARGCENQNATIDVPATATAPVPLSQLDFSQMLADYRSGWLNAPRCEWYLSHRFARASLAEFSQKRLLGKKLAASLQMDLLCKIPPDMPPVDSEHFEHLEVSS